MTNQQLISEIERLKRDKNVVILAHYYARPEIQDLADFVGDSLQLARQAATTTADIILFCGVHFMAETAAILSPEKKVLSPTPYAGCSLAEGVTASDLRKWKSDHPGGLVVSYVNTTAEVKSETDYCVTSSNALEVVESLPSDKPILFGPDKNLGTYIARKLGRDMDIWNACCFVHDRIDADTLLEMASQYPDADVLIHPESLGATSDKILNHPRCFMYSTSGILSHAHKSSKNSFVIATEPGVMHLLKRENPTKTFIPVQPDNLCYHMKEAGLFEVYEALQKEQYVVEVPEFIRKRAILPLERMLAGTK